MRSATAALLRPSPAIESSGPPTVPCPSWLSNPPNIGTRAAALRLVSPWSSSCGMPAASTNSAPNRIAECAGRFDTRRRICSSDIVSSHASFRRPGQGTQLLLEPGVPELLERGVAEHDDEARGVGQEPQDVLDDGRGMNDEVDDDLVRLVRELAAGGGRRGR